MKKLEFKPEDFKSIVMPRMSNGRITADCLKLDEALIVINARLAEMLAEAPLVYREEGDFAWVWFALPQGKDTHTARLVDIQKLGEL